MTVSPAHPITRPLVAMQRLQRTRGGAQRPASLGAKPVQSRDVSDADPLGLVGTTIGEGLQVVSLARRGGMTLLYRVHDPASDTDRAFKVYMGLAELEKTARAGFFRSATDINRRIAYLAPKHSALVQVFGVGSQPIPGGNSVPCTLTEWLEGKTLEVCLDEERMRGWYSRTAAEAFALMEGPMEAVAAIQERGIVHRDLKPGSFFVEGGQLIPGAIKVLDFSLAKFGPRPHATVTFLTPNYAAPEQFRGDEDAIGPATDVFGLALVLVELILGGRTALAGKNFSALRRASEDESRRPTPRTLGVEIPNVVETVFKRALAVDPRERYPDVGAFCKALRNAISCDGRVTSSRVSRVAGVLNVQAPGEPVPVPAPRFIPRGNTEVADVHALRESIAGGTVVANEPVRTGHTILAAPPERPKPRSRRPPTNGSGPGQP